MSTVLLDTNIVSFIFKEDSRVRDYAPLLLHQELAIAPMTVAELYQWAAYAIGVKRDSNNSKRS